MICGIFLKGYWSLWAAEVNISTSKNMFANLVRLGAFLWLRVLHVSNHCCYCREFCDEALNLVKTLGLI